MLSLDSNLYIYISCHTGVDKTFQRGDMEEYGVYVKEIPMHKTKIGDNKKNTKSCWYESGVEYDVVKPQSIVPMDLSHFKVMLEIIIFKNKFPFLTN